MTKSRQPSLARQLSAEFLGSAFLAMVVVGSGIAAQQLSPGNVGLQLLENSLVTGAGLFTLITVFAPVSGAHFNPVVTLCEVYFGNFRWRNVPSFMFAQVTGCISGAVTANYMFGIGQAFSTHHRASGPHFVSESLATLGLLLTIFALKKHRQSHLTAAAVASYITAAYFFTSSTSFANPAITIGRMFTTSFAGIAPNSVVAFISAQLVGLAIGVVVLQFIFEMKAND